MTRARRIEKCRWTSGDVTIRHADGSTTAIVSNVEFHKDDRIPPGMTINPRLASPASGLREELAGVLHGGGEVKLGRMRVLNGGGILVITGKCPLNLAAPNCAHSHVEDRVRESLRRCIGADPTMMAFAVMRDMTAPLTYGVIDGGGAGRGDTKIYDMHSFVMDRCLNELVTEIGITVTTKRSNGWVGYRYHGNSGELMFELAEQWREAFGPLPGEAPICALNLKPLVLPDTLVVTDWHEPHRNTLESVSISFELENASLEVIMALEGVFQTFPKDGRLSVRDLETGPNGALDRRVAVIFGNPESPNLAWIMYQGGHYDHTIPVLPLTDEIMEVAATTKFANVLRHAMQLTDIVPKQSGVYAVLGLPQCDDDEWGEVEVYEHPERGLCVHSEDYGGQDEEEDDGDHVPVRRTGLTFGKRLRGLDEDNPGKEE